MQTARIKVNPEAALWEKATLAMFDEKKK